MKPVKLFQEAVKIVAAEAEKGNLICLDFCQVKGLECVTLINSGCIYNAHNSEELREIAKKVRVNADDIIGGLSAYHGEDGRFEDDFDLGDGVFVHVEGKVSIDGFYESDTHAWVETYRDADISVMKAYDEDGEDIPVPDSVYNACVDYLNQEWS